MIINRINKRGIIAFIHDIIMAGLAFNLALYLRLGDDMFAFGDLIQIGTLSSVILAVLIFYVMGLYRGVWRYASVQDLIVITKAASLLILLSALILFFMIRLENTPRSLPLIYWFILMTSLGGPRFIYRIIKDRHFNLNALSAGSSKVPVLLVGAGDGAELFLRALKRNPQLPYRVVGILTEKVQRLGLNIHGVTVLGMLDALPNVVRELEKTDEAPQKLILTKDDWAGERVRALLDDCEEMGISLARLPKLTDLRSGSSDSVNVRPIDVQDLLGRPQKALDKSLPQFMVENKRILVTGAGGSIGSELVRQICSFRPNEIILLEASEFALYTIDMEIATKFPTIKRQALICNIRDKNRLHQIFEQAKPQLVFHAAALKHVPLVEANPLEGILTNAIGSKNVADACVKYKVSAMVQISTDKAVNPTNIMGATKRVAECYTQALDLANTGCRFTTVRFGNVLGSTGSVVPLFQKQLNEGGPLTVTHKDMNRYFMTVREAVELVLQAAVMAQKDHSMDGKICVLDMGQPVKILHLAEQMIKLSGFEPYKDIDIQFTGLRPGEKLFEEIFHGDEPPVPSSLQGVLIATPRSKDAKELDGILQNLERACMNDNRTDAFGIIKSLVPELIHE